MNIGESQHELVIEPLEEPRWIEEPSTPMPQHVPTFERELVTA